MKLSKAESKKLRSKLPKFWHEKIAERLTEKGINESISSIKAVVYGRRFNKLILEEAILLKEEHQADLKELKKKNLTMDVDIDLDKRRYDALKMAYDGVGREIEVTRSDNRTKVVKVSSTSILSCPQLPIIDDNALFIRSISLTFKNNTNSFSYKWKNNSWVKHMIRKRKELINLIPSHNK